MLTINFLGLKLVLNNNKVSTSVCSNSAPLQQLIWMFFLSVLAVKIWVDKEKTLFLQGSNLSDN